MIFKLKPKILEGFGHVELGRETSQQKKNSMCKGPETERSVCSVPGKPAGKWGELRSEGQAGPGGQGEGFGFPCKCRGSL